MGSHLVDGRFQSDKYPTCPAGKVPLSTADPLAQDLLWEYAARRERVDAEFSGDLRVALEADGYRPPPPGWMEEDRVLAARARECDEVLRASQPGCTCPDQDTLRRHREGCPRPAHRRKRAEAEDWLAQNRAGILAGYDAATRLLYEQGVVLADLSAAIGVPGASLGELRLWLGRLIRGEGASREGSFELVEGALVAWRAQFAVAIGVPNGLLLLAQLASSLRAQAKPGSGSPAVSDPAPASVEGASGSESGESLARDSSTPVATTVSAPVEVARPPASAGVPGTVVRGLGQLGPASLAAQRLVAEGGYVEEDRAWALAYHEPVLVGEGERCFSMRCSCGHRPTGPDPDDELVVHFVDCLRARTARRREVVDYLARHERVLFSRQSVDLSRSPGETTWLLSWPLGASLSRVRLSVCSASGGEAIYARVHQVLAGFCDDVLALDQRFLVPTLDFLYPPTRVSLPDGDLARLSSSSSVVQAALVYASDPEGVAKDEARARAQRRSAELSVGLRAVPEVPGLRSYVPASLFVDEGRWVDLGGLIAPGGAVAVALTSRDDPRPPVYVTLEVA